MKIAFILPSLNTSAPIKITSVIVNSLLINTDITIDIYYFDKSINTVVFNTQTYRIKFLDTFDYKQYDIIHSVMFRPDLYVLFHKKRIGNVRCISSIHQYIAPNLEYSYNRFYSLIFTPLWYLALNRFDDIIVLSSDMKKYYEGKIFPNKYIVYNGLDSLNLLPDNQIIQKINLFKGSSQVIACIGGLTMTKGFDQIISVLSELNDTKLIIIGAGKEKDNLQKLSEYHQCNERVLFLGHIESAGIYMYLMDMILIPSRSEGFSLVLLEAVSQKIKILCSNISIFKELFEVHEIGFFDLEDLEDLKLNVRKVLSNSYNIEAFLKYKGFYTEQKMIDKYLDIYMNKSNSLNSSML